MCSGLLRAISSRACFESLDHADPSVATRGGDRPAFPAGRPMPDDAAHAAVMIQDPPGKARECLRQTLSRHPGGGRSEIPRRPKIQQNRRALQIPAQSRFGSARELVKSRILCGSLDFLKGDVFGVGDPVRGGVRLLITGAQDSSARLGLRSMKSLG
jgi:hypothetical protein